MVEVTKMMATSFKRSCFLEGTNYIDMRGGLFRGIGLSDGRTEKFHSLLTASRRHQKARGVGPI